MRVSVALATATALLCGVMLLGSSSSRAASSISARCSGYKALRASNSVCEYRFEQPFLLSGYSRGGASTLTYAIQCASDRSWPPKDAAIDRRVWYKRSFKVSGNFALLGARDAPSAAEHCFVARGKTPILSVTLKMNRGVTRTNLVVKLDNSLPWGS
ncbi:MAG: hypothetical protein WBQ14_02845 [Gaiellaceae bacterium]